MQKSGVNFTETLITAGPSVDGSYPMILIGQSERGPDGLSDELSSFSEFVKTYGNPVAGSYTNDAVYLYTKQGDGPEMQPGNFYFVRVSPAANGTGEVSFKGLTSANVLDTVDALKFRAVGKGKWGAKVRVTLAPSTAGDVRRINVTVSLYDAETAGNLVRSETYENLFYRTDDRQNPKYIETVLAANSKLVRATVLIDAVNGLVTTGVNDTIKPLVNASVDSTVVTRDDIVPVVEAAANSVKGVGMLYLPDAYNVPDATGASPTYGAVVVELSRIGLANRKLVVVDEVENGTTTTAATKVTGFAGLNHIFLATRWGYTAYRQSVAVPLSAAWIGKYSTRANRPDMGLHFPASNLPLSGVVGLKPLAGIKLDDARTKNVNVFMELDQGGIGLYGIWTPDKDADGFRQVGRRLIWWDIQFQVQAAINALVQNSPVNKKTLKLIDGRVVTILKRNALRGVLVGLGGSEARRGNGYDWVADTTDQVALNSGKVTGILTLRDAATLEELSIRMTNYNDLAV